MGRNRDEIPDKAEGKTKTRIKVSSAKAKGRSLQQWACQQISTLTGFEWGSSGDDKPIESRPMGQMGCDVRMESHVRAVFPFSVECKYQESWSIHGWLKQAQANEQEGTDWLLICRRSRMKPIIMMDAIAFFKILKKLKDTK